MEVEDTCSTDFGPFDGDVFLDCADQGPLPRIAAKEAREAIEWKINPRHLTFDRFIGIPQRLKSALGRLIEAPPEDIILANSASYGLHLLANGMAWKRGDEILLAKGDFPSNVLPWLALERKGVNVRLIESSHSFIQPEELLKNIRPSTRLFCTSLVHSFTGVAVDAEELGRICKSREITFVLNCSQALGARQFKISDVAVDVITSTGSKWLCGPYGTGFCWIRPELRVNITCNQAYWLARQTGYDLQKEEYDLHLQDDRSACAFDVFGTANFFNFKPWAAAIEYLLEQGIGRIEDYNRKLVTRLIEGLDYDKYELLSPREEVSRSALTFISRKNPDLNEGIHAELKLRGLHIALRRAKLRISPHLYNTEEEIDTVTSALNSM